VGKAARTKAAARRTPARRAPTRRTPWGWIGVGVAVIAAVAALVWQTGRSGDSGQPVALTHIHGLGINPADGNLYVATHDGLYQLPADGGAASLVGQGRQDTMGFTIAGPNQFLASGHPAPGQGGPPHLGLIESSDAGTTWNTRSLAGDADLHALRFRHNIVYGYNSVRGQLIASTDKVTWQTRATMAMRDFDVSPTDPQTLLATTETGLQRSSDGGATWSPSGGPPLVLLAWEAADRLWGITTSGDIVASADGGTSWDPSGKLAGQATAFAAHNGNLYASVHERGIFRSSDGGSTWTQLYSQAA
jgi:photosystem II stability/assembly factor-like uncharacterized protein